MTTQITFLDRNSGELIAGRTWPGVPRDNDYVQMHVHDEILGEHVFKTYLVGKVVWLNDGSVRVYMREADVVV